MRTRPRSLVAVASAIVSCLAISLTACQQQNKSPSASDANRGASASNAPGAKYFSAWPEGKSPQEIGDRVARRFVETPHLRIPATTRAAAPAPAPATTRASSRPHIIYPEVCTWYGALTFAKATDDQALREQLVDRFEPFFGPKRIYIPEPNHVDNTVFAAVPLELYVQTRDPRYLELGKEMADKQWAAPFGSRATTQSWEWHKKGLTWQTRLWIDDMFMITAAQAQAYRATGDRKYIDRAAREMVVYLDTLQKPNGLFYHDPKTPYFWGRGNGWMAAGTAELLRSLPEDNPDRPRIMKGYKLMMESLLKHQADDGMWRQLIDDPESWRETSCTGMFAFAFITGVKHGWLDAATYGPAARKAWLALTTYLDENADIREVCEGTNIHNPRDPKQGPDGRAYYLARRRITGDMHGQAPVLWCATALLRDPAPAAVAAQ